MKRQSIQPGFTKVLVVAIVVLQLTACGGGGGGSESTASLDSPVEIGGSVGDGPVTGATVVIYNDDGQQIDSVVSDSTASFKITVRAKGNEYPLLLESSGGFDLVTGSTPDFQMLSVMLKHSQKQVNINPFSTLIVKIAQLLPGGANQENVRTAKTYVTDKLGFGLDPDLIGNPITTSITDENVANIVKASEALGEMVRRTRDSIIASGTAINGDGVMDAIAADMTDGFLDGTGAQGANPTISAVATVVSAQVLVEALSNNLKVGGVLATGIIDQAIATTRLNISSSKMTGNVRITKGMLKQTKVALRAAQVVDTSSAVIDIVNTVNAISANALPGDIEQDLPAGTSEILDVAISESVTAGSTDTTAINQVVYSDGSSNTGPDPVPESDPVVNTAPVANTAPVISGTPAGSVVVNETYVFRPSASDADGNLLAFSIANRPAWASFDDTTGRLSGTPGDTDTGLYDGIRISVTDGLDTVSLPAFSIRVDTAVAQMGSFTLTWTAPATRADGTPLSLADIDGFRVYYGETAGDYPSSIDVADGSAQTVTVTDVPVGDYRVVMTTYDVDGRESGQSAEISKTAR
jgi:hypothetical protein